MHRNVCGPIYAYVWVSCALVCQVCVCECLYLTVECVCIGPVCIDVCPQMVSMYAPVYMKACVEAGIMLCLLSTDLYLCASTCRFVPELCEDLGGCGPFWHTTSLSQIPCLSYLLVMFPSPVVPSIVFARLPSDKLLSGVLALASVWPLEFHIALLSVLAFSSCLSTSSFLHLLLSVSLATNWKAKTGMHLAFPFLTSF